MHYKLGVVESRFADIVWSRAPLAASELVKLCAEELHWKRTTTYTVLKKLSEYGLFRLEKGLVTALVSREDYYAAQSERFVAESFNGSLPAFIAAFTRKKALSQEDVDEIRRMIDAYPGEDRQNGGKS